MKTNATQNSGIKQYETSKGGGVKATKTFNIGDTVVVAEIEKKDAENNVHASQVGVDKFFLFGGIRKMINHSCSPNCGIKVNKIGAHDLVAIKEINVDDEITYDYAMENYEIGHFPKVCMCGSPECRVQITGWKDLTNEKKIAYKNYAAPYLLELD